MRKLFLIIGLSLSVVICAGPPLASAYRRTIPPGTRTAARWANPHVELTVHAAARSESSVGLTTRVQHAADAWSTPHVTCTSVKLAVATSYERNEQAERDGVNRVVFHRRDWCHNGQWKVGGCYDPRIAAITTLYYADHANAAGELTIEEADIELNAVNFAWTDDVDGPALKPKQRRQERLDLQTVLIHELGHVLGFAHACERRDTAQRVASPLAAARATCSGEINSVMVPSADQGFAVSVPYHKLFADDLQGLCQIYPGPRSQLAHPTSLHCSAASAPETSRHRVCLLVALTGFFALQRLRRRRMRRASNDPD